jgi:hypothetical protein
VKLRVRHNSIRFRLGQSDVQRLREHGRCHEAILFPGGSRLEYVLLASSQGYLHVAFANNEVSISVPEKDLTAWHSSDQVGIRTAVEVHGGKDLEVLIEKDFQCLDPEVAEDQSDGFQNPLSAQMNCSVPASVCLS